MLRRLRRRLDALRRRRVFEGGKRIMIFGVSESSRIIKDYLDFEGISACAVLDNDARKAGGVVFGLPVGLPGELLVPYDSSCVILIDSQYQAEIVRQLAELGYRDGVFGLYRSNEMFEFDHATSREAAAHFARSLGQAALGYALYRRIAGRYRDHAILMCPYTGIGDVYLIGLYLRQYLEKERIGRYVLLVVNKGCYRTAKLFQMENVLQVSRTAMFRLKKAGLAFGGRLAPIRLMNDSFVYTNGLWLARGLRGLNFAQMFKACVFRLGDGAAPEFPPRPGRSRLVDEFFRERGLRERRTVILAPYATTLFNVVPMPVWERLAARLLGMGYSVCTNSSGAGEPAVAGTQPAFFPISHVAEMAERAGWFIGVRSGLCDIVSGAACVKIILYPRNFAFGAGTYLEYFSLNRMGLCSDAAELEYDADEESCAKLFDHILAAYFDVGGAAGAIGGSCGELGIAGSSGAIANASASASASGEQRQKQLYK
jgi:hypothetical protein